MRDLSQLLMKFNNIQNFEDEDFFISKSNEHILELLNKWPKWEKNFLNIIGEKFSGKTHLINIFLKKFNGLKLNAENLNNEDLKKIKLFENIILEDLNEKINEKLIFTLLNIIEQDNKYIIVTTIKPVVDIDFSLIDLKSRTKNFLLQKIEKPDDDLMFALILKNLSDRQISLDKKFIFQLAAIKGFRFIYL